MKKSNHSKKRQNHPIEIWELILLSSFFFAAALVLVRFLMNAQMALLLRLFDINFEYQLFGIKYLQQSGENNWSLFRTLLIYGAFPMLWMVAGIILSRRLNKSKSLFWKTKLLLTWLAFVMTIQFPVGLVAGVFIFDEIGFAFTTMFNSMIIRSLIASAAMTILIVFRSYWLKLFLKTSYSRKWVENTKTKKKCINILFIYPWISIGSFLILYAIRMHQFTIAIMIAAMGLIILPLFNKHIPTRRIKIIKPKNQKIILTEYKRQSKT